MSTGRLNKITISGIPYVKIGVFGIGLSEHVSVFLSHIHIGVLALIGLFGARHISFVLGFAQVEGPG